MRNPKNPVGRAQNGRGIDSRDRAILRAVHIGRDTHPDIGRAMKGELTQNCIATRCVSLAADGLLTRYRRCEKRAATIDFGRRTLKLWAYSLTGQSLPLVADRAIAVAAEGGVV